MAWNSRTSGQSFQQLVVSADVVVAADADVPIATNVEAVIAAEIMETIGVQRREASQAGNLRY
jgi:hypothetical protein